MLQEWTMTAKGSGVMAPGRDGQTRAQGTWYQYSVDLSAYAGQNIYVAIRHFNCTDWFYLDVDDVTFTADEKSGNTFEASGKAQITSYAVPTDDGNWYYYDNGTNYDAIGLTGGGGFWWGIMFPAGSFEGNKLSKISYFDSTPSDGQVLISQGGTSAPGTLLYTQNYSTSGIEDVVEINMDEPVTINNAENLWVIITTPAANMSPHTMVAWVRPTVHGSLLTTQNGTHHYPKQQVVHTMATGISAPISKPAAAAQPAQPSKPTSSTSSWMVNSSLPPATMPSLTPLRTLRSTPLKYIMLTKNTTSLARPLS
jgi:hypothetical protein